MLKRRARAAAIVPMISIAMGAATMADPAKTQRAGATQPFWLWHFSQESDQEKNGLVIDGNAIQSEIQIAEPGRLPRGLGWYAISAQPGDPDVAAVARAIREHRLVGGEVHEQASGGTERSFPFRMPNRWSWFRRARAPSVRTRLGSPALLCTPCTVLARS